MKILNVFENFNFEYLVSGVIFAILYMVWSVTIKPRMQKKEIKTLLSEVASKNNYELLEAEKERYDYVFKATSDQKYQKILIKVVEVPKVSSITVNSKYTWNLQYGGSGAPGKSFLYQRYLNELIPFLKMESEEGVLKVVLVYKSTMKIQRYLNESDIAILKYSDLVYDYKIITFTDFNSHFTDL